MPPILNCTYPALKLQFHLMVQFFTFFMNIVFVQGN